MGDFKPLRRIILLCLLVDAAVVAFPIIRSNLGYVGSERFEWGLVWVIACGILVGIALLLALAITIIVDLFRAGRR